MIKKVLVSAMTAMLLLTSGCEQPPQPVDPPAENPTSEVDKPVKSINPLKLPKVRLRQCKLPFIIPMKPV